jgi:ABC-type uncharacterized transport system substrate-binding protein
MIVYRKTIYSLAERYRLPTIYPYRVFAAEGGLMSYGVDVTDLLRGAASYIDRILRGEKPNELAVQQPTRFELVVNVKTAKMLGLTISNIDARCCPRGDRIAAGLLRCALSASGTKRTFRLRRGMSAIGGKADIAI